jgi:DNA-binding transcriptional ArsR family regulator
MWQYSHMEISDADRLDLTFAALADPTRRAILARLASGDADVSEIMRPFDVSQPTISKHLAVLERAGLVTRHRDAQRRPRALAAAPLKEVAGWIEQFRQFWEGQFTSLDRYLDEVQRVDSSKAKKERSHDKRRTKR